MTRHLILAVLRVRDAVKALARDERGSTTEHVIWIAFLAALALVITGLLGPKIISAAKSIVFK